MRVLIFFLQVLEREVGVICVVCRLACPSIFWMVWRSAPWFSIAVAKEWRSACGPRRCCDVTFDSTVLTIRSTEVVLRFRPCRLRNMRSPLLPSANRASRNWR